MLITFSLPQIYSPNICLIIDINQMQPYFQMREELLSLLISRNFNEDRIPLELLLRVLQQQSLTSWLNTLLNNSKLYIRFLGEDMKKLQTTLEQLNSYLEGSVRLSSSGSSSLLIYSLSSITKRINQFCRAPHENSFISLTKAGKYVIQNDDAICFLSKTMIGYTEKNNLFILDCRGSCESLYLGEKSGFKPHGEGLHIEEKYQAEEGKIIKIENRKPQLIEISLGYRNEGTLDSGILLRTMKESKRQDFQFIFKGTFKNGKPADGDLFMRDKDGWSSHHISNGMLNEIKSTKSRMASD